MMSEVKTEQNSGRLDLKDGGSLVNRWAETLMSTKKVDQKIGGSQKEGGNTKS